MADATGQSLEVIDHRVFCSALLDSHEDLGMTELTSIPVCVLGVEKNDMRHPFDLWVEREVFLHRERVPLYGNAAEKISWRNKSGSIAESVGKGAMEKDTSRKSPRAGLSHCAWKSARATDFHFYHSPGDGELSFRSDSGKK
jgi:hypothetical protein